MEMESINKITPFNLQTALRMYGVEIDTGALDLIIDIVEILKEKGDSLTINDIDKLRNQRKTTKNYFPFFGYVKYVKEK